MRSVLWSLARNLLEMSLPAWNRTVGQASREMFIGTLCAVLQRQPAAVTQVRGELEQLRARELPSRSLSNSRAG